MIVSARWDAKTLSRANVKRERRKEGRKEKKRKGKKKRKGRNNTTFLRRRGFSSRRVNDQPVVETNNDIMVIRGSTFSSSWRIPSLSVPSLDPLLPLQGNKVAPVFKTKPPFLAWKIRERCTFVAGRFENFDNTWHTPVYGSRTRGMISLLAA